jgi:DNA-binding transcriptional MerR regulator
MERMVHIGEGARSLGVSPKHLKVLERTGRIPPARRDQFGDRVYTELDLALLRALGVGQRPRRLKSPDEVLAGVE